MTERILNSVAETASRLGVGRTKVYEEQNAGRLEYVMIGDRRFTPEDSLADYVQRLRDERRPSSDRIIALVDDEGRLDVSELPADATLADLRAAQEVVRARRGGHAA